MNGWERQLRQMLAGEGDYGPDADREAHVSWGFSITEDLRITCTSEEGLSYWCVFTADELSQYGDEWQARVRARLEEARHLRG